MNDRDETRILAALLAQGSSIHLFSCAMSIAAMLLFFASASFRGIGYGNILVLAMLLLGVVETVMAFRVGFDARLFGDIAQGTRDRAEELDAMDETLWHLGLLPMKKAGRSFAARRKGAVRLLKVQAGCALGQCTIPIGIGLFCLF